MAITITKKQQLITSSNGASYALASFVPKQYSLLVAIVYAPGSIAGPFGMGAAGSTEGWRRNTTLPFNSISDPGGTLILFTAWQEQAPIAMAPAFTCAGDPATGCLLALFEVEGANASYDPATQVPGQNAIGALGGPTNISDGSANPTLAHVSVLSGAPISANPTNACLAALANNRNAANYTASSGWVEQIDTGISGPTSGLWAASRLAGETGLTTQVTGASAPWAGLYLEICAPGQYPQ